MFKKEKDISEKLNILKDKAELIHSIFKDKTESIIKDEIIIQIRSKWNFIAGALSLHSIPVKLKGKILTVRVEKSVYAQELNLYTNWIMDRLEELSFSVDSIKIETGTIKPNEKPERNEGNPQKMTDNNKKLTGAQFELLEGLQNRDS
ncbi:MAG: DUF721 domain-containing protein [Spirochaetia bacterium]|nr:DUF721 domain-containing protein [Spirochaetia bacterium]